eukprot:4788694-Alexandrium_andersonii.AAC.1
MSASLVGSEMCIRDRPCIARPVWQKGTADMPRGLPVWNVSWPCCCSLEQHGQRHGGSSRGHRRPSTCGASG